MWLFDEDTTLGGRMVCLATYTVEIRRVIDKEMSVAAARQRPRLFWES